MSIGWVSIVIFIEFCDWLSEDVTCSFLEESVLIVVMSYFRNCFVYGVYAVFFYSLGYS